MLDLDIAIENHLMYNLLPAIDLVYAFSCRQAIEYCRNEEDSALIEMPEGYYMRAYDVVDRFRLDSFID